jgi:hypothetical protein
LFRSLGISSRQFERRKIMTAIIKPIAWIAASGLILLSATTPALARDGYDRGHDERSDRGWRSDNPHRAIEMCSRVAEREVSRNGYGRARVTDIRDIRETRWGFEVRGRIAVSSASRWGGGYRNDFRSWRNHDDGSFKCRVENGRIADIDIDGIRGL